MERHLSRAHHGAYVRRQGGWHSLAGPLQHVRVSLLAGRSRVRLSLFPAVTLLLGAYFLFVAAPADAQRIPTVSLSAPRVLDEGTSRNVTVELTAPLSHGVTIPVTVSRMVTARGTGRYTIGGLQNPSSISFTIAAGSRTSSPLVLTALADDDRTHQFITLALDTDNLPPSVLPSNPYSVRIAVRDVTDPPVVPAVQLLTIEPNPVPEGSPVSVTVILAEVLTEKVTIPLTLTAVTAEEDDYGSLASITVRPGFCCASGHITTTRDADDDDETFTVALGSSLPAEVVAGSQSSALVTISEGSGAPPGTPPTVSLPESLNPVTEGASVTVTATLSEVLPEDVDIPVRVRRDTSEEDDHGTLTGITIRGGARSGTGTIETMHDADTDDETFMVEMGDSLPSTVTLGSPDSVKITITDDDRRPPPPPPPGGNGPPSGNGPPGGNSPPGGNDPPDGNDPPGGGGSLTASVDAPTVSLAAAPNPVAEGSPVTVTATLSAALASDATIPLTLTAGTAEADDYGPLAGITISSGETSGTATITTVQDADTEDETFTVALGSNLPDSVSGGTPSSVEVTIEDLTIPPPGDTGLSSLTLSAGTLEPRFAAATRNYTAEVAHAVASVTVTPTARDSRATVRVNDVVVASGSASAPVSLGVGETAIRVLVTAENAVARTYTVTVTRAPAPPPVTRAPAPPAVTEEHRRQRLQVGLAGLGRSVAASAVSVIGQHLARATEAAGDEADLAGVELTLNRRALRLSDPSDAAAGGGPAHEALQALGVSVTPAGKLSVVPHSDLELLSHSAFHAHQGRSAGWGVWGSGAAGGFQGEVDAFEQEGAVLAGYLGADYRFGAGALAGLAASYHNLQLSVTSGAAGEADLTGWVVNVYPYGFWMPAEWLGLWAVAGLGAGAAEVAEQNTGADEEGDLRSWLGAAGQRVEFLSGGGLSLAAKADGFITGLTADGGLPAVSAHAWRARVLLEGGLEWHAPDTRLAGRVEFGGRLDGGDAEQGLGAEAGAEVSYTHTGIGLGIGGRGRLLIVHEDQAIRDWGASATLRWEPAGAGTGPALSVVPAWGRVASGPGVLWQDQPLAQELMSGAGATAGKVAPWLPDSVALRLSYGLDVAAGAGRVLPYAEVGLDTAQVRRVRAGATVDLPSAGAVPGGMRLEAFGQRTARPGSVTDHRIGLEGSLEY